MIFIIKRYFHICSKTSILMESQAHSHYIAYVAFGSRPLCRSTILHYTPLPFRISILFHRKERTSYFDCPFSYRKSPQKIRPTPVLYGSFSFSLGCLNHYVYFCEKCFLFSTLLVVVIYCISDIYAFKKEI